MAARMRSDAGGLSAPLAAAPLTPRGYFGKGENGSGSLPWEDTPRARHRGRHRFEEPAAWGQRPRRLPRVQGAPCPR